MTGLVRHERRSRARRYLSLLLTFSLVARSTSEGSRDGRVPVDSLAVLSVEDQERVRRTIEEGGGRATSDAPLAWLRFEPSADRMCCEVRLRSWPGRSDDRLLTTAGYHERPVRWLA